MFCSSFFSHSMNGKEMKNLFIDSYIVIVSSNSRYNFVYFVNISPIESAEYKINAIELNKPVAKICHFLFIFFVQN